MLGGSRSRRGPGRGGRGCRGRVLRIPCLSLELSLCEVEVLYLVRLDGWSGLG